MDQSTESTSTKEKAQFQQNTIVCLEQNINLPSNLLQKRKNVLQQMRMIKTSQNSRNNTSRQPVTLMSKTFANYRDVQKIQQERLQMLIEQPPTNAKDHSKQKKGKNPLYRRLSDIQAQSKQLAGVSFSKLLSRMLVIQNEQKVEKRQLNDYRKKQFNTIDSKLRSIPNYECLQSKLFTIQCPQGKHQSSRTSPKRSKNISPSRTVQPVTKGLFKRYFNPHGQRSDLISSNQAVYFDERYIYRNGRKSECKRIHNFYTSATFRKSYDKHMRNSIDTFYPSDRNFL